MKIVIVGATGTIGKVIVKAIQTLGNAEIIEVGNRNGRFRVDLSSQSSITSLFEQIGEFDALVCAAGNAHLEPLATLEKKHFMVGLENKLLGQVNLVLTGKKFIKKGGSFTLTSGILAEDPIKMGTACAVTDAAINGFVISAAAELVDDLRINAVAPGVLSDSPLLHQYFQGHIPVDSERVAAAYLKSIFSGHSGKILRVY